MTKLTRTIVLELMRPIVVLGSVIEKAVDLVYGPALVRRSREMDRQFGLEIKRELGFLFDQCSGRLLPDETLGYPRPFDYTIMIVASSDLFFRFIRGRGEFRVQVSSPGVSLGWEDRSLALRLVDPDFCLRDFSSLAEVGTTLESRITQLREAFSEPRLNDLKRRLAEVHRDERLVIHE